VISVHDLTFAYPSASPLIQNFDCHVRKGSLYGLLGPNGAGKTTLISLISGLNKPQSGEILIDGKNFKAKRKSIFQRMSVVPQEYAFYGQMTAFENLDFFSRMYPGRKQANDPIQQAIKLTGLENYQHRLAKHFSGGLKRRLNLAIGLLNRPDLLILDEPTTGIDPQSRHFILQAIKDLNTQGTTIVYTSHYMEEVEQLCDEIAIMDHGKILVSGTLDELLHSDSVVKLALACAVDVLMQNPALVNFIQTHSLSFEQNYLGGLLAAPSDFYNLMALLQQYAIPIESVSYGRQSLESLFFQLTHRHLRDS
jgi:ABC-2 type transport system ATP-binding protein